MQLISEVMQPGGSPLKHTCFSDDISLVTSSNGLKASMARPTMDHCSSLKHNELFPRRQSNCFLLLTSSLKHVEDRVPVCEYEYVLWKLQLLLYFFEFFCCFCAVVKKATIALHLCWMSGKVLMESLTTRLLVCAKHG